MKMSPLLTLVAEDSEDDRFFLHRSLRRIPNLKLVGFVPDGSEAIHYLRGAGQFGDRLMFPFPDLLMLDFQMPRCDGMEVLEFLQNQPARPYVILWSCVPELLNAAQATRLGADLVCEKPLEAARMGDVLRMLQLKLPKPNLDFSEFEEPALERQPWLSFDQCLLQASAAGP
jgi:CheY-like chemotaxis protein